MARKKIMKRVYPMLPSGLKWNILVMRDYGHDKFWAYNLGTYRHGEKVVCRWGRIGTNGVEVRYNLPSNNTILYFVNGEIASKLSSGKIQTSDSGYLKFESKDALKMIELRELFPTISLLIDEAKDRINSDNQIRKVWWSDFNKTMNKWVSMINL